MLSANLSREQVEFIGQNHAGIVRQVDGYWYLRVLGNCIIKVPVRDESLVPGMKLHGYWEAWVTSWFTKNVGPKDTFYDVGANVGYFACVAGELGARMAAFEPNPELADCLHHTLFFAGYDHIAFASGLSDKEETVTLEVPGNLLGSASTVGDFTGHEVKEIECHLFPLDDIVASHGLALPTLIKMDIEGGEEKAWDGMQNVLKASSPTVLLEYSSGRYSADFPQKLHDYGDLYIIDTAGEEQKISKDDLESFPEFEMVVVRP